MCVLYFNHPRMYVMVDLHHDAVMLKVTMISRHGGGACCDRGHTSSLNMSDRIRVGMVAESRIENIVTGLRDDSMHCC